MALSHREAGPDVPGPTLLTSMEAIMPIQANEKWILTVKELHLGFCKETFRAGAVIELDETNGRLIIDGRRFNDTRDLDVLKRQADNHPENPWVIPFSPEARKEIMDAVHPKPISQAKQLRPDQRMQVIQSDEDLTEDIDISATKISKVNAAAKLATQQRVKTHGMEIIRGDESVEDRLASLKGKNDISSIAERARIKASGSVNMPIVKDDSLGAGFSGKNSVSMNAGQHLPSRAEADAKKADAQAQADARKKQVEAIRKRQGDLVEGDTQVEAQVVEEPVAAQEAPVDAEKVALKAENDELKARMDRLEKMMVAAQGAAPKRGKKVAAEE